MDAIREDTYKGHTIQIFYDEFPANPWTEWDEFGMMWLSHKRYSLADDVGIDPQSFNSLDEVHDYLVRDLDARVYLPIYMYEHGGIAIRVGRGFNDRWDSGQIGFILATGEQIRKEYGVKRITRKVLEKVENLLRAEAETYGAYLSGEVYGYKVLDEDGEELDSCWGFYGDFRNYAIQEAKNHIDWHLKNVYHQIPLLLEV